MIKPPSSKFPKQNRQVSRVSLILANLCVVDLESLTTTVLLLVRSPMISPPNLYTNFPVVDIGLSRQLNTHPWVCPCQLPYSLVVALLQAHVLLILMILLFREFKLQNPCDLVDFKWFHNILLNSQKILWPTTLASQPLTESQLISAVSIISRQPCQSAAQLRALRKALWLMTCCRRPGQRCAWGFPSSSWGYPFIPGWLRKHALVRKGW